VTWKLALRHLSRHWRLNLMMLTIMVLGASLLASLPMLAVTIAGESLSHTLESAPVQARNIIIQGKSKTDEPPADIELSLGALLSEMMAVREGDVVGFTIISKSDGTQLNLYPVTLILNLKSFDRLDERVQVLDGRLPQSGTVAGNAGGSPIFEAAIGAEAAGRTGLGLGDEVSPAGGSYHLRIVGIVEPIHPDAETWWGDSQMTPFSAWRRIHISPDIDEWNISLLVHPKTMTSKIYHNQYWRVILDHEKITASNAPSLRETLTGLQSSLSEDGFVVRTELIDLIARFEEALALAHVSLLLLTFQSLFVVFYLLGMFGNFLVEGSRLELATLSGRGFSRGQITGLFARSTSLLALFAGAVAPLVARLFLVLWSNWQGLSAPNLIPPESRWLALSTGLFSWIFLVISVYRSTHRDLLLGQGQGMRYDERALTQRHLIWDIFILALGGLAYWQLIQGSIITGEIKDISAGTVTGISDLVLLLGPSLLLLAIGLILIRLEPYLWRFLARISLGGRGLIWNLVFTRLARNPVGPGQVTLLISLTAGLIFFASAFTYSIDNWQQAMARYVVGADIRLRQPLIEPAQGTSLPDSPGITAMTQVIRTDATFLLDEYLRLDFDLLAVDPDTFSSVASFPPGIGSFSMDAVMSVLQSDSPNVLPVIISSNVHTNYLNIGDQIILELGTETYPAEIVGIIINFPLLDDIFAITDLSLFAQQVDLESMALTDQGTREIWLAVEPDEHVGVVANLSQVEFENLIAGNSREQLEVFQNNLVFREVATAFILSALILIPLSGVGFFLIQLFSTQRRGYEFDVLQAIGLSKTQLKSLLIREGVIYIFLGMLIGIGIGIGLVVMMQPFLLQILPPLMGGLVFDQIMINWSEVGIRLVILMGFYAIGLLVLTITAFRNQRSVHY